jgi:hypothetical protein
LKFTATERDATDQAAYIKAVSQVRSCIHAKRVAKRKPANLILTIRAAPPDPACRVTPQAKAMQPTPATCTPCL